MPATPQDWWPRKPTDFAKGDVIITRRGVYPRDAMKVVKVTPKSITARHIDGGHLFQFSASAIHGNRFRKATPGESEWPVYVSGFTMDVFGGEFFEAWTAGEYPLFEYSQAVRMLRAMDKEMQRVGEPFSWEYDSWRDSFIIHGKDEDEVFRRKMVEMPGEGKKLYPIGDGWSWQEYEPPHQDEYE